MDLQGTHASKIREQEGLRLFIWITGLRVRRLLRLFQRDDHNARKKIQNTQ